MGNTLLLLVLEMTFLPINYLFERPNLISFICGLLTPKNFPRVRFTDPDRPASSFESNERDEWQMVRGSHRHVPIPGHLGRRRATGLAYMYQACAPGFSHGSLFSRLDRCGLGVLE